MDRRVHHFLVVVVVVVGCWHREHLRRLSNVYVTEEPGYGRLMPSLLLTLALLRPGI